MLSVRGRSALFDEMLRGRRLAVAQPTQTRPAHQSASLAGQPGCTHTCQPLSARVEQHRPDGAHRRRLATSRRDGIDGKKSPCAVEEFAGG